MSLKGQFTLTCLILIFECSVLILNNISDLIVFLINIWECLFQKLQELKKEQSCHVTQPVRQPFTCRILRQKAHSHRAGPLPRGLHCAGRSQVREARLPLSLEFSMVQLLKSSVTPSPSRWPLVSVASALCQPRCTPCVHVALLLFLTSSSRLPRSDQDGASQCIGDLSKERGTSGPRQRSPTPSLTKMNGSSGCQVSICVLLIFPFMNICGCNLQIKKKQTESNRNQGSKQLPPQVLTQCSPNPTTLLQRPSQ